MKKIASLFILIAVLIGILPTAVFAEVKSDDIVILYENDVHCALDGYSKLAALKNELKQTHNYVGVVSSGDYIQGSSMGVVSKGEYIVRLMNLVGYDALTLGNHEFDYKMERLNELVEMMNTKPVCCNFAEVGSDETYFEPYSIVNYGDTKVAFVGVTTPSTVSSSAPSQFKDENGNYIYTFHATDLYETVQQYVNAAKNEGADYVIALTHVGDAEPDYDIADMISVTTGIDAVLDAHSHSVIEGRTVRNASGKDVLLTSTGTEFAHIGKLTISSDGITSQLIKTADYTSTDPDVDAYLAQVDEEYSAYANRKIAESKVDLIIEDKDGNRLIRNTETNLGDLISDAMRTVMGADIAYINGGGVRANINKGDITYDNLLNIHPFGNTILLAEITGSTLRDLLEMTLRLWPEENGSFPHLSGIKLSVNTSIPSSVVINEYEEFVSVDGQYRVYGITVLDRESGEYLPLDLSKKYTFAAISHYLVDYGGGLTMLEDATIVKNDGLLDVEMVEEYLVEHLGGVVGEEYAEPIPNITFTDGEIMPQSTSNVLAYILIAVSICAAGAVIFAVIMIRRKKHSQNS